MSAQTEARAKALSAEPKRKLSWLIISAIALILFVFFLLYSEKTAPNLDLRASNVEEMQRGEKLSPISTEITRRDSLEIPGPSRLPQTTNNDPQKSDELQQLIAELREALSAQRDVISPQQLETALRDQRKAIDATLNNRIAALNQNNVVEAAYERSIRVQRDIADVQAEAARKQELERQIESPMLVFDQSEKGLAAQSAPDARAGLSANEAFLRNASASEFETARATPVARPSRTIVQGAIIQGVLETAINTDLPSIVRAVVSRPVRSFDGSKVLLPPGTRLIGKFNSNVSVSQSRVSIAWTRAVTPKGLSIALGSIGADTLGRSGSSGEVDTHFYQKFGSAALISILGATPTIISGNTSTQKISGKILSDIGEDFRETSSSALDEYLSIPPTIHIPQGAPITVLVNRDLVF